MKKLSSLVAGLSFVALSMIFGSLAASPVITVETTIPNPSATITPSYTFNSTQAGTISYAGMCGDGWETTAEIGSNTITYGPLPEGVPHSNCAIRVINNLGESSNILEVNVFTIVLPELPVIHEIIPIPNPATTLTPSYTFSSTQVGTIQYEGTCGNGDITNTIVGDNLVTYSLTDGQTHNDCTIQVTNTNGNSNILALGTFTVTTGSNPPVIHEITPIPNPATTLTPSYTFSSTQVGTIQYEGTCGNGNLINAGAGNNTVTYSLVDGQTYSDCTIQVVNAGEYSNILDLSDFTVDLGGPEETFEIVEISDVPNISTTLTPEYVFSTEEDGTIIYEGDCDFALPLETDATTGGNITLSYGTLVDGQSYNNNCEIYVENAGGYSNTLYVNSFTVDLGGPEETFTIAEISDVPNISITLTPEYVFTSEEAGVLEYTGTCDFVAPIPAVTTGENTLSYGTLVDGETYNNNCKIKVTNAGGYSNTLNVNSFTVDLGGPEETFEIVEISDVPNISTTLTPEYVFSTEEDGTIKTKGTCDFALPLPAAITGGNIILSYGTLVDGNSYNENCEIYVENAGGYSNDLAVNSFTIDLSNPAPVIIQVTPISDPTTDTTPSYVFSSSQIGNIVYGGSCGNGDIASAAAANNTVTYSLVDGQTYSNCTIQVINTNGISNILAIPEFTVNTGTSNLPVITQVTPIPNPSLITTPSYVFSSTQIGTILYGGTCGNGDIASAGIANNTIIYSLVDGQTYNDCTIQVTNGNGDSNILTIPPFMVNIGSGPTPPVIAQVTPISDPSTTATPSYIFSSTQMGTVVYGGSCNDGDLLTAASGNNTASYSLTDGQTYSDCTLMVTNANGDSNILVIPSFTVEETPIPPVPPVVTSGGGGGSGKAGNRFSGQRRDDYARSGKFWDMSRSIADIERINQGYLGRVTTYINRNGFSVFGGYLPGQLSLDYLNSRIQRTHKFVYRGERDQRSGNIRRDTKRPWDTHPQIYFRNRWAHNAIMGIEKAVAFDPKEAKMSIEGGEDWIRPQWRRGGVWARDHVSINSNADPNKIITPLPSHMPRISLRGKEDKPISLGVRRIALQYTVAKGVSRIRPVRIESAASPAYEVFVTDNKNPWADDKFLNRRETLEMRYGQGTGERTIKIEMAINPAYGVMVKSSQGEWGQGFLNRMTTLQKAMNSNNSFTMPDSSVNRVPALNEQVSVPRYSSDLERWRAYKMQKYNRVDPWERRPFRTLQGAESYRVEI